MDINRPIKYVQLVLLATLLSPNAKADVINEFTGGSFYGITLIHSGPLGQSFMATSSNIYWIGMSLGGEPSEPQAVSLQMDLLRGEGLAGETVASRLIDTTWAPGYLYFNFSGVSLDVGSRYTLVLQHKGGFSGGVSGGANNYAYGSAFAGPQISDAGRAWLESTDFFFRVLDTEYIPPSACHANGCDSPSAVPESETYVMLLAGLGLLGAAARRRVNKRSEQKGLG